MNTVLELTDTSFHPQVRSLPGSLLETPAMVFVFSDYHVDLLKRSTVIKLSISI